MSSLENYLRDLRDTRATGENVKETSFYPSLSNLFNSIGAQLNPKVRVVINIRNRGAGLPDGGLFTARQLKKPGGAETSRDTSAFSGQQPERGVVEVKSAKEDVRAVANSEQVRRYLNAYGQVLVTNLREFLLVTKDRTGHLVLGESYALAHNEKELWERVRQPHELTQEHAARFTEYLKRVMLTLAPLEDPKDLAWFLASYARDAKARIEKAALPSLQSVREAMEQALEIKFEGAKGEAFFRSTLIQTLFYGVFSAWVLWSKSAAKHSRFRWHEAVWSLHVPVIATLFERIVTPSNMRGLGLVEVLDWTAETLNRVRRDEFFTRFEEEHAVQYFYEPFLEAFDPDLRKQLGVWYTPTEIVRYMVERVDRVLRTELNIADGLADERVYVLDPCCGTGAYLVEVLKRIKRTIDEQGGDALAANDLKLAAQRRVFGFEILPAPFVVAHLQLGLLLQRAGSPLVNDERVGVYLTNALTGWEPPQEPKKQLAFDFHALQEERDAAEEIKREKPILVVLGNPPYNGYAGVALKEERQLSEAYRATKHAPAPQGQGLNDLYVRFFRVAERRIVENTGVGVVCYISNYSWLDGLSFTGMRERYLAAFDSIEIDCLNGDKYKTGKLTPDGKPDPSVFSTDFNKEGIQVGTAIALLVKKDAWAGSADGLVRSERKARKEGDESGALDADRPVAPTPDAPSGAVEDEPSALPAQVHFRHWWGKDKRAELLAAAQDGGADYTELAPVLALGLPFIPAQTDAAYTAWPLLPELFPVSFPGVKTSRDDVVVDIDRERLEQRMRHYFDPNISHAEMKRIAPHALEERPQFQAEKTRDYLRKRGFLSDKIVRFLYRPFDVRWLYWEPETNFIDRKREDYFPQVATGNVWLAAVQQNRKQFDPPVCTKTLCAGHIIERGANLFPLYLQSVGQSGLFDAPANTGPQPNLSDAARRYLQTTGSDAATLFYHALALLHAPLYRTENAGALRQDWPRIPLPASLELLEQSAALGREIAALLDTETQVAGVTTGRVRPELRLIANIRRADGAGSLNPDAGDLAVRAGWGHRGQGGVVMPGKGRRHTRAYAENELASFAEVENVADAFGAQTHDVCLNDIALWSNIPARVWDYTIGGYQVLKKWLSYREQEILRRGLNTEEAREVTGTARRIAAILLLEAKLNENYERSKADSYARGI